MICQFCGNPKNDHKVECPLVHACPDAQPISVPTQAGEDEESEEDEDDSVCG